MSIKSKIGGLLVAAMAVGGVAAIAPAQASQAAGCSGSGSFSSTYTRALKGTCQAAQARLDRKVSGVVKAYYGTQGANSYVSSSAGTWVHNYMRAKYSNSWTGWGLPK